MSMRSHLFIAPPVCTHTAEVSSVWLLAKVAHLIPSQLLYMGMTSSCLYSGLTVLMPSWLSKTDIWQWPEQLHSMRLVS